MVESEAMLRQNAEFKAQSALGPADTILGTQPGRFVLESAVPSPSFWATRDGGATGSDRLATVASDATAQNPIF